MGKGLTATKSNKIIVPDYLVREVVGGERWFYRGYRDVLNGLKQADEIMACSSLQSIIVNFINNKLWNRLEDEPFWVMSNEIGNNISKKSKAAYDVAVFSETVLPANQINTHYPNVPPQLVVEVDLRAESEIPTPDDVMIQLKTQKLLDFGVQKVIWFFTKSQKVMIATADDPWTIADWNRNVELWEGLSINIATYLSKRGINSTDVPRESL